LIIVGIGAKVSHEFRCHVARETCPTQISLPPGAVKFLASGEHWHTVPYLNCGVQEGLLEGISVSASAAKSVLVVDDSQIVRSALCELFTQESDFDVCGEAENGREGIDKAKRLHPDLIIMDMSMPLMNGLDAARVLKGIMPTVPIIMYSNFSDVFMAKEAVSVGIAALVSKAESISTLIARARMLVRRNAA